MDFDGISDDYLLFFLSFLFQIAAILYEEDNKSMCKSWQKYKVAGFTPSETRNYSID